MSLGRSPTGHPRSRALVQDPDQAVTSPSVTRRTAGPLKADRSDPCRAAQDRDVVHPTLTLSLIHI
eukprot:1650469-Pyramimonas_sp.AAC.1